MFHRALFKELASAKKSILLIGPRQTGKSTLIQSLRPELEINLAHEPTFLEFARNPRELESRLAGQKTIFIDEIQRLPRLTNTIQVLLDGDKRLKFLLTGSSARKLRRGRANLLPGRILSYELGPLTFPEIGDEFDLEQALSTGLLPGVYSETDARLRKEILSQYAATYLREEIAAEGLVRNLEGFARFLHWAAVSAAELLDLSKISSQALVPRPSATRLFEILEDTLIIRRCPAFARSERTRLIQHPKYYFFDNGVWNGLLKNFIPSEDRKGKLFETFIFNQLHDSLTAARKDFRLSHFRTEHGAEVDFILEIDGSLIAIEAKASRNVGASDLRGMGSFESLVKKKVEKWVLYLGEVERTLSGVHVFPWAQGLKRLLVKSTGSPTSNRR